MLEPHMIWPDSGSYRNSSLLQPPASWLFLEHTHSPALLHLHWRLLCLEGTPPDILVDILSCPSRPYSNIISSTRPTLTTLVKQPHSLHPHAYTRCHLPQSTCQSLGRHFPHLLGSLCPLTRTHCTRRPKCVCC